MIVTCPHNLNRAKRYPYKGVLAVGGGRAIDAGKRIAADEGLYLTVVPSLISTDAMFTDSSAVSWGTGGKTFLRTKKPDEVIFDPDLGSTKHYGWGDVLSIYTAEYRWRRLPGYDQEAASKALGLLDRVCLPNSSENLRILFDALREEVEICDGLGHSMVESGLEHEIAESLEVIYPGVMHGVLLVAGILRAAQVQGQDLVVITERMGEAGLLEPAYEVFGKGLI